MRLFRFPAHIVHSAGFPRVSEGVLSVFVFIIVFMFDLDASECPEIRMLLCCRVIGKRLGCFCLFFVELLAVVLINFFHAEADTIWQYF